MTFETDNELTNYGLALDPCDPRKAVPIGEVVDRQQKALEGDKASAESFARETSNGAIEDVANWTDQAVLAGMATACAEIRNLDASYPERSHRLGTFIIESKKRFGGDATRQRLRAEGISGTRAYYAEEIARQYTYEQAVQFPSDRAIKRTLTPKQPRNRKVAKQTDCQAAAPQEPTQDTDETALERFIQLGIEVMGEVVRENISFRRNKLICRSTANEKRTEK